MDLARAGERPRLLADRPLLDERLAPVLDAFWALEGDRGFRPDGRPCPIPFAAFDAWARRFAPGDLFDRWWELLRRLDRAWLDLASQEERPDGGDAPADP